MLLAKVTGKEKTLTSPQISYLYLHSYSICYLESIQSNYNIRSHLVNYFFKIGTKYFETVNENEAHSHK